MSTEVVMPQMGESIAEGTITKWMKKVGDHVERDEPLFEISTDKVDAEIPSPAAGILTEIRFQEGETVEINTTVAVLDGGAASNAQPQEAAVAPAEAPKEQVEPEPSTTAVADAAPQQTQVEAAAATGAEVVDVKQTETAAKSATSAQTGENAKAATPTSDNGRNATASAEDLRRTKSSPLVRKIAQEHGISCIVGIF